MTRTSVTTPTSKVVQNILKYSKTAVVLSTLKNTVWPRAWELEHRIWSELLGKRLDHARFCSRMQNILSYFITSNNTMTRTLQRNYERYNFTWLVSWSRSTHPWISFVLKKFFMPEAATLLIQRFKWYDQNTLQSRGISRLHYCTLVRYLPSKKTSRSVQELH